MIKFLEITPPVEAQFRNSTVISCEVEEGDEVRSGDTLFTVQNGEETYPLPAILSGKIAELIVEVGDRISSRTSLLLLETEVEDASDDSQQEDKAADDIPAPEVSDLPEEALPAKDQDAGQAELVLNENEEEDTIEIVIPDLGGAEDVDIVELMIAEGDVVEVDQSLLVLETDKATVEVPATIRGRVIELFLGEGDKVSEGSPILSMAPLAPLTADVNTIADDQATVSNDSTEESEETIGESPDELTVTPAKSSPEESSEALLADSSREQPGDGTVGAKPEISIDIESPDPGTSESEAIEEEPASSAETTAEIDIIVPDMGGAGEAEVIEVFIQAGDRVAVDDPLVTVETDKATVDIPSAAVGKIMSVTVKVGDKVAEGGKLGSLAQEDASPELSTQISSDAVTVEELPDPAITPEPEPEEASAPLSEPQTPSGPGNHPSGALSAGNGTPTAHASPSIRKFARELGVDVNQLTGSGRKGRILRSDVQAFVKSLVAGTVSRPTTVPPAETGSGIPSIPEIDFSKFGPTETAPLSKIKRLTAVNLHRSWLNLPHVTYNEEVDISELEAFRQSMKDELAKEGIRITPLAFQMKAIVSALRAFPSFNASLEPGGQNLILKKYYNIGVAVDTPDGLVVPVLKDVDKKGVIQLAGELGEVSKRARDKKLTPAEMQGGTFTISSLGGIGGTSFTPIINAPEVAIMGVCRSRMKPVWNGSDFEPKLLLPLSLSYDHRVVDGAESARFVAHVGNMLSDVRRLLL